MSKLNSSSQPIMESREVAGHTIEYCKIGDLETITIDAEQMPFFRVGDSYQLESNAYAPEQPTLLKATEAYAATLPGQKN